MATRSCLRAALAVPLALALVVANAASYRIEPTETTASFEVWVMGLIPIRGQFTHTFGALRFDPVARAGYIEVSIDTTGIEANSARAQTTARGPGFFNVEKYPRVDFTSSRFVFEGNRLRAIEGMLTLTGSTQPVTLAVNRAACKAAIAREPAVCRAEAAFTVKRSAFGMKAWSRSIGDDVTIRIAIVAFGDELETKPAKVENMEKADQPRAAAPAVEVPKRQSWTTK